MEGGCMTEEMWAEYIHFLYARIALSEDISIARDFLIVRLRDVFERAMEGGCMTEELFMVRASFLLQGGDQSCALQAIEEGLQEGRFPASPALWTLFLHIKTQQHAFGAAGPGPATSSPGKGSKGKRKRANDLATDTTAGGWASLLGDFERALAAMPTEKRGAVYQLLLPLLTERAANKPLKSPSMRAGHAWFRAAVSANMRGGAETGQGDEQTVLMEHFVCWYIEWIVLSALTYAGGKAKRA